MKEELLDQAQDTKKDRKLTIQCTPTLIWNGTNPPNIGATMAFADTASDPNMPGAVNSVTGDIDISNMPKNTKYTDNIDITLLLDTSNLKDANGNPLTGDPVARWAHSDEGPTYTDAKGKTQHLGYCWFCQITDLQKRQYIISPPIDIAKMSISRPDHLNVLIDDNTADGSPAYAFCMAFVLPGYDDYYISIDPLISSKSGGGDPPFMLKK